MTPTRTPGLGAIGSLFPRRKPKVWKRPDPLTSAVLVSAHELEELGTDARGVRWFAHPQYGEFSEGRHPLTDTDVLPDAYLVQGTAEDGTRVYRQLRLEGGPGTFAANMATPARTPKPKPAPKPVDALDGLFLAGRQSEIIVAAPRSGMVVRPANAPAPYVRKPQPAARGAEQIIARLRKSGATVALDATGTHVVVTSSGGRPGAGVPELVEASAPLLVAYLAGSPLLCTVTDHKGKPPEAVTLALGGSPWCAACSPKESKA